MNTRINFAPAVAARGASAPSLAATARKVIDRMVEGIEACADYAAAAAICKQLRRLSDAELRRRGLSRESLARDVCVATDRTGRGR